MTANDEKIIAEFKNRIGKEIHGHIRSMRVFGSRARGNAAPNSDMDILILVDKNDPALEAAIDEVAYRVMWDSDFNPILSVKVMEATRYEDFLKRDFSFYRNVNREGISI